MRAGKASRINRVLLATLGDSFCLWLLLSSSSLSSEHKIMLTVTFSYKPIVNSLSVKGTSNSWSRRLIDRISCLLTFLDFFLVFEWQGFFFVPCLFLRQRGFDCIWLYFFGLRWVTRVYPSSSSWALLETSIRRSISIRGPLDSIGTTIDSELPNWIVINFFQGRKSIQCLLYHNVKYAFSSRSMTNTPTGWKYDLSRQCHPNPILFSHP